MADRKYYVICESGCRFESMTKEQILTAIMQAVETGKITDVDAGFVTTIKTIDGSPLRFFVGTQARYEALSSAEKENLFAIITNDTTKADMLATLETLRKDIDGICETCAQKEELPQVLVNNSSEEVANINSTSFALSLKPLQGKTLDDISHVALSFYSEDMGKSNTFYKLNGVRLEKIDDDGKLTVNCSGCTVDGNDANTMLFVNAKIRFTAYSSGGFGYALRNMYACKLTNGVVPFVGQINNISAARISVYFK